MGLTIKVGVRVVLDKRSRAKVYQFQLKILQIHENIFIFDIAMDYASRVTGNHSFHDLNTRIIKHIFNENINKPV